MTFSQFIRLALVLSNLAPLIAAWIGRRGLTKEDRPFWFYLFIYFFSGLAQFMLARYHINNWWVIHLTTVGEFVCAGLLFAAWEPNRLFALRFRILTGAYAAIWVAAKLTVEPLGGNAPYTAALAELLLLSAALYTLFQFAHRLDVPLQQSMRFWIATAILLGSATDLFLWTIFPMLTEFTQPVFMRALYVNWLRVLAVNILFIRGLLCKPFPTFGGSLQSAR